MAEFALRYQLPNEITNVLDELGFRGPQFLARFLIEDSMLPRNKKGGGFGLILGHAAELEEVLEL
jgi:hypothetical protein